jgi:hypothetical protein
MAANDPLLLLTSSRFAGSQFEAQPAVLGMNRCALTIPRRCLIRLLRWRLLSGNFNRVGCRSASGHLFNVNPVEDRRAPFPAFSGDTAGSHHMVRLCETSRA